MGCKCDNCGGGIVGLAHIGIRVRDMEVSKKFYIDALGFELTDECQMGATKLAFLNIGDCKIELIQPADYAERVPGQIDHIAVEVTEIEPLVCRLIEKGVRFDTDQISDAPGLLGGVRNIFFSGPDGERIEFFEYLNR
ncbi:MAG: VOC family protein [Clostridiales bacterium]|nr:VOC family protein [Clostridiales bacterium]